MGAYHLGRCRLGSHSEELGVSTNEWPSGGDSLQSGL